MTPKYLRILAFISIKCITCCLIYFFTEHIKSQENVFFYTFISFYVIERLISYCSIIGNLNLPYWEIAIITLLNPIQLDELWLLITGDRHQKYQNEGIHIQALLISIASIPLYITTLIWTVIHPQPSSVILTAFILLGMIFALFIISFIALHHSDQIDIFRQNQLMIRLAKEFVFAALHNLTYIALICINLQVNNFGLHLLTMYIIIITAFIRSIYKRVKIKAFHNTRIGIICFYFALKEIFHIVIDIRFIANSAKRHSVLTYGLDIFNKMLITSFAIKLYLLSTFIALLYQQDQFVQSTKPFYLFVLISSSLSVLILGYRVFIFSLMPLLTGPKTIEYEYYSQLSELNYKNLNSNYYSHLEAVFILELFESIQTMFITKLLFYSYKNSEILSNYGKREIISDSESKYQEVKFCCAQEISILIGVLKKGRMLPQIKQVNFEFQDDEKIIELYQILADHNSHVIFNSNYDGQYYQLPTLFLNVRATCFQHLAFQKFIQNQQSANPKIIFYDLFDDINS